MGVDGICTDYPELVHEANRKFRPQAARVPGDVASFPFPQEAIKEEIDVQLRGLADHIPSPSSSEVIVGNGAGCGRRYGGVIKAFGAGDMGAKALGGWFERPSPGCTCHKKRREGSEEVCELTFSDQQRLLVALYGDLGSVRDYSGASRVVHFARRIRTTVCVLV